MAICRTVDMQFFDNAPKVFTNELELNVSAETVFASFQRADDWPLWVDSIAGVEWTTPAPFGIGTTRRVTFTNDKFADELFIAWQENKQMAFCFTETDQPGTNAFAEDYQLTELPNGSCKLVWRVAFDPAGMSKLVFLLFGFAVNKVFKTALAEFKVFIEQQ